MNTKHIVRVCRKIAGRYRVTDGSKFRLKDVDPGDTGNLRHEDKPRAKEALAFGVQALSEFQERLYAQDQWAILLVFQAMDAAGKDGVIKHVMSGINPQGCQVHSFKAPTTDDLDHDYFWRCARRLPERGRIGIFNRSYYEEVLVVRVHHELLQKEQLPPALITRDIWKRRFKEIRSFERNLTQNGIVIRKFFLHVSKTEQKKRFLNRLDQPNKNWKFSLSDLHERERWTDYQHAYEETIRTTATKEAPWHVVPADNKWFTRIIVAAVIVETLDSLRLKFPTLGPAQMKVLSAARKQLLEEK
jgi:PPK2 family polyphosphate:nucleotide phosphotransferase